MDCGTSVYCSLQDLHTLHWCGGLKNDPHNGPCMSNHMLFSTHILQHDMPYPLYPHGNLACATYPLCPQYDISYKTREQSLSLAEALRAHRKSGEDRFRVYQVDPQETPDRTDPLRKAGFTWTFLERNPAYCLLYLGALRNLP